MTEIEYLKTLNKRDFEIVCACIELDKHGVEYETGECDFDTQGSTDKGYWRNINGERLWIPKEAQITNSSDPLPPDPTHPHP